MLKDILRFHVAQEITGLFKKFIYILEDLREEHRAHFEKLRNALPPEYHPLLDQADYFDQDRYSYFRKRILDHGNETKRYIDQAFDKYEQHGVIYPDRE